MFGCLASSERIGRVVCPHLLFQDPSIITNTQRIDAALPTIKYCLDKVNSVAVFASCSTPFFNSCGHSFWTVTSQLCVVLCKGCKSVVLCSHLGRPDGSAVEKYLHPRWSCFQSWQPLVSLRSAQVFFGTCGQVCAREVGQTSDLSQGTLSLIHI